LLNTIDISNFTEESYMLTDDIEILFSEEGLFILSSNGMFSSEDFNKIIKNENNFYILFNEDKDQLQLNEEQYTVIKKLIEEKIK